MENLTTINEYKYDDGLTYIYHIQSKGIILAHFHENIKDNYILCQELGEILHYISTYRPTNMILLLTRMDNFLELYKKIGLQFFQILPIIGIKRLAFVSTKNNHSSLLKLVENLPIQSNAFEYKNDSKRWIEENS